MLDGVARASSSSSSGHQISLALDSREAVLGTLDEVIGRVVAGLESGNDAAEVDDLGGEANSKAEVAEIWKFCQTFRAELELRSAFALDDLENALDECNPCGLLIELHAALARLFVREEELKAEADARAKLEARGRRGRGRGRGKKRNRSNNAKIKLKPKPSQMDALTSMNWSRLIADIIVAREDTWLKEQLDWRRKEEVRRRDAATGEEEEGKTGGSSNSKSQSISAQAKGMCGNLLRCVLLDPRSRPFRKKAFSVEGYSTMNDNNNAGKDDANTAAECVGKDANCNTAAMTVDLMTIQRRLADGNTYETVEGFLKDARALWDSSLMNHDPGSESYKSAVEFSDMFEELTHEITVYEEQAGKQSALRIPQELPELNEAAGADVYTSSGVAASTLLSGVIWMREREYASMPLDLRIGVLRWLVQRCISTRKIRSCIGSGVVEYEANEERLAALRSAIQRDEARLKDARSHAASLADCCNAFVKRGPRFGRTESIDADADADSESLLEKESKYVHNDSFHSKASSVSSDDSDESADRCSMCGVYRYGEDIEVIVCRFCSDVQCIKCRNKMRRKAYSAQDQGDDACIVCCGLGRERYGTDHKASFAADKIRCMVCGSRDDEDKMVLCDGCDRGYHLACMSPPLDDIPEGDWFCKLCAAFSKFGQTLVLPADASHPYVGRTLRETVKVRTSRRKSKGGASRPVVVGTIESVCMEHAPQVDPAEARRMILSGETTLAVSKDIDAKLPSTPFFNCVFNGRRVRMSLDEVQERIVPLDGRAQEGEFLERYRMEVAELEMRKASFHIRLRALYTQQRERMSMMHEDIAAKWLEDAALKLDAVTLTRLQIERANRMRREALGRIEHTHTAAARRIRGTPDRVLMCSGRQSDDVVETIWSLGDRLVLEQAGVGIDHAHIEKYSWRAYADTDTLSKLMTEFKSHPASPAVTEAALTITQASVHNPSPGRFWEYPLQGLPRVAIPWKLGLAPCESVDEVAPGIEYMRLSLLRCEGNLLHIFPKEYCAPWDSGKEKARTTAAADSAFCSFRYEWLTYVRAVAAGGDRTLLSMKLLSNDFRLHFKTADRIENGDTALAVFIFGRALLHLESVVVECAPEAASTLPFSENDDPIVLFDRPSSSYKTVHAAENLSRSLSQFLQIWIPDRLEWRRKVGDARKLTDLIRLCLVFESRSSGLRAIPWSACARLLAALSTSPEFELPSIGDVVMYEPRLHKLALKEALDERLEQAESLRQTEWDPGQGTPLSQCMEAGVGCGDVAGYPQNWISDPPYGNCRRKMFVHHVSYFSGGGDPYAVCVLGPCTAAVQRKFERGALATGSNVQAPGNVSATKNSKPSPKAKPKKPTNAAVMKLPKAEIEDDEFCTVCMQGGELLCCEHKDCTRVYHMRCLGVDSLPDGIWECPLHRSHVVTKFNTQLLTTVIDKVCNVFNAQSFYSVPEDQVGYIETIANPISLELMRRKAVLSQYTSTSELLEDFELMRNNCHVWCASRYPDLLPVSDRILKIAKRLLSKADATGMPVLEGVCTDASDDIQVSFIVHNMVNRVCVANSRPKHFIEFSNGWLVQRENLKPTDKRRRYTSCDGKHFTSKKDANEYAESQSFLPLPVQGGRQKARGRRKRRGDVRASGENTAAKRPSRRKSARVSAKDSVSYSEPKKIDDFVADAFEEDGAVKINGVPLKSHPGFLSMVSDAKRDPWEYAAEHVHGDLRDESENFLVCCVTLSRFSPFALTERAWRAYRKQREEKELIDERRRTARDSQAKKRVNTDIRVIAKKASKSSKPKRKKHVKVYKTVERVLNSLVRVVEMRLDPRAPTAIGGLEEERHLARMHAQKKKDDAVAALKAEKKAKAAAKRARAVALRKQAKERKAMFAEDFLSAKENIRHCRTSGECTDAESAKRMRALRCRVQQSREKRSYFMSTFSHQTMAREATSSEVVHFQEMLAKQAIKVKRIVQSRLDAMVSSVDAKHKHAAASSSATAKSLSQKRPAVFFKTAVSLKVAGAVHKGGIPLNAVIRLHSAGSKTVMAFRKGHWWPSNILKVQFDPSQSLEPRYAIKFLYAEFTSSSDGRHKGGRMTMLPHGEIRRLHPAMLKFKDGENVCVVVSKGKHLFATVKAGNASVPDNSVLLQYWGTSTRENVSVHRLSKTHRKPPKAKVKSPKVLGKRKSSGEASRIGEFFLGQRVNVDYEGTVWTAEIADFRKFKHGGVKGKSEDGHTLYTVYYPNPVNMYEHGVIRERITALPGYESEKRRAGREYPVDQKVKVDYEGTLFNGVVVDPAKYATVGAMKVKPDDPFKGENLYSIFYPKDGSLEHNVLCRRIVGVMKKKGGGVKRKRKDSSSRSPSKKAKKKLKIDKANKKKETVKERRNFTIGQLVKVAGKDGLPDYSGLVLKPGVTSYAVMDYITLESEKGVPASRLTPDEDPNIGWSAVSKWKRTKFRVDERVVVDYEGKEWDAVIAKPSGAGRKRAAISLDPATAGWISYSVYYPGEDSKEHNVLEYRIKKRAPKTSVSKSGKKQTHNGRRNENSRTTSKDAGNGLRPDHNQKQNSYYGKCVVCEKSTLKSRAPVLICDSCDRDCHLKCAKLAEVPPGEFFCPTCAASRQEQKKKKRRRRQGSE